MQLYLLRHGIAEDGRPGQSDSDRALTSEGFAKLRGVLEAARDAGVSPSLILTSPYRRALETAQVAAQALHYKEDLLRTPALTPESTPEAVWEELRLHNGEPQILAAGHEPLFSALTGFLLGCPNLPLDFKKGAMVRIDFERLGPQPHGVLKWMLTPKLAR